MLLSEVMAPARSPMLRRSSRAWRWQFSASVSELADPSYMGTALTLQTSLGFALTLVTIWGMPLLAERAGWRFAFVALAPGPLLGCCAMAALRRRPEALRLAAGRR